MAASFRADTAKKGRGVHLFLKVHRRQKVRWQKGGLPPPSPGHPGLKSGVMEGMLAALAGDDRRPPGRMPAPALGDHDAGGTGTASEKHVAYADVGGAQKNHDPLGTS